MGNKMDKYEKEVYIKFGIALIASTAILVTAVVWGYMITEEKGPYSRK